MDKDTDWVLPAGIPFADLKGRDLEECVYWLFDAMGAPPDPDFLSQLRIERNDGHCKVGFALDQDNGCPYSNSRIRYRTLQNSLAQSSA